MNSIKEIERINRRELELGAKGSWHDQYKDSAYVFVGGIAYDLTEGDVIAIFSQWGEIMDINLPRDKETGKTRGFGFIMYEDQRSTVLAVDNMNGAQVLGRTIRVDHCVKYRQKGEKNAEGEYVEPEEPTYNAMPPTLEGEDSESSGTASADEIDDEDPMAAYLRQQKQKEKKKRIENGQKKRKHDSETTEERKARRDAKKARMAVREAQRTGQVRVKEEEKSRERGGGYDEEREERAGRANRDDWRQGRWELERDDRQRGKERLREEVKDGGRRIDQDERERDGAGSYGQRPPEREPGSGARSDRSDQERPYERNGRGDRYDGPYDGR